MTGLARDLGRGRHPAPRGSASLLERSGFGVVGQAGDGVQLLALVHDKAPELVVVDIRMPPTNTTEGAPQCHRVHRGAFGARPGARIGIRRVLVFSSAAATAGFLVLTQLRITAPGRGLAWVRA
jgi:DNA-binding NarL/FixJ family response regulator